MSSPWDTTDDLYADVSPARGLDAENVERNANELRRRQDTLNARLESERKRAAELLANLPTIEGRGSAENGSVAVVVDANGRLKDLTLTAGALRLSSASRLRNAIMDAVAEATEEAMGRVRRAVGGATPTDPMTAYFDAMPEVVAMLPSRYVDQWRKPPESPQTSRKRTPSIWEDTNPYE